MTEHNETAGHSQDTSSRLSDEHVEGAKTAKYILAINKADSGERIHGRLRIASLTGATLLLFAKVQVGLIGYVADMIGKHGRLEDAGKLDTRWVVPTSLVLYGLSSVFRRMRDSNKSDALYHRTEYVEFAQSNEAGNFAQGVVDVLNVDHKGRQILCESQDNLSSLVQLPGTRTDDFLYNTDPRIEQPTSKYGAPDSRPISAQYTAGLRNNQ